MEKSLKLKAIERLGKALEEIKLLKSLRIESPNFVKWRRDTEIAIANTFGENPQHINDFKNINFDSIGATNNTSIGTRRRAYRRGLGAAEAILKSMIEEIKEYWEEESEANSAVKNLVPGKLRGTRVFICYAKEDRETAIKVYHDLSKKGINCWVDSEDLLPGQYWDIEIPKAIKSCDYFLLLLSKKSVSKRGYVQKEVKIALDVLEEFPSSKPYLIPVRIEQCEPDDEKLRTLHWVDLFLSYEKGLSEILRVLTQKKKMLRDNIRELNELLKKEIIDDAIPGPFKYKVCPKCGSEKLKRSVDSYAESEFGDQGEIIYFEVPYNVIECLDCDWRKTEINYYPETFES